MSFLGRFLGTSRSNAISEGLALLEEERFAEAADRFRIALEGRSDAPSHSLASMHLRKALVAEGRRLLRAGRPGRAVPFFAEAAGQWDLYPDLHCLLGAARGMDGDWNSALTEARTALRLNSDYVEARLLEAVALKGLQRNLEAAKSLEDLVETGRRVDHWLIASLGEKGEFQADNLPADLDALLEQAVSGRSEKEEVAAAVAQCRAGNWEEGLVRFDTLVKKRPRYPDYRTRHAAAYFQLGRNEEALAEVNAALALNENYGTAIDLKGLVLADSLRIVEARDFLAEADANRQPNSGDGQQGDLFGAYLRGVLALLTGDAESIGPLFDDRPDLVRDFARAELLLAAADDLLGSGSTCGRRLGSLADEWPGEAIYFFLLACHHIQSRRFADAADVLGRWPAGPGNDIRPLYLEDILAIARGQSPTVVQPDTDEGGIRPEAWEFLSAKSAFLREDFAACWQTCRDIEQTGPTTERLLNLMISTAGREVVLTDPQWQAPGVIPESCLASSAVLQLNRNDGGRGFDLVERQRDLHPELLLGYWLSPEFWLNPIRTWIG